MFPRCKDLHLTIEGYDLATPTAPEVWGGWEAVHASWSKDDGPLI